MTGPTGPAAGPRGMGAVKSALIRKNPGSCTLSPNAGIQIA